MINKEGGREVKRAHNEKGYTLFLVVLMIVVFSVISMSLITVTISGAKRSEVRENVTQAGELAEKGLKHLMNQIDFELQQEIEKVPDGMKKSEFIEKLEVVVDKYTCDELNNLINESNETGEYTACVEEHIDKGSDSLPHKVRIQSKGIADGKNK